MKFKKKYICIYVQLICVYIIFYIHTYIYMLEQCKWMEFIVPVLKI